MDPIVDRKDGGNSWPDSKSVTSISREPHRIAFSERFTFEASCLGSVCVLCLYLCVCVCVLRGYPLKVGLKGHQERHHFSRVFTIFDTCAFFNVPNVFAGGGLSIYLLELPFRWQKVTFSSVSDEATAAGPCGSSHPTGRQAPRHPYRRGWHSASRVWAAGFVFSFRGRGHQKRSREDRCSQGWLQTSFGFPGP